MAEKHKWIYCILCPDVGAFKIGISYYPWTRVSELQTGCPLRCVLIGFVKGTAEHEKRIHAELDEFRIRNEWFRLEEYSQQFVIDWFNAWWTDGSQFNDDELISACYFPGNLAIRTEEGFAVDG